MILVRNLLFKELKLRIDPTPACDQSANRSIRQRSLDLIGAAATTTN